MASNDKRKALGRGLESLLPSRSAAKNTPAPAPTPVAPPTQGEGQHELEVSLIDPNPYQTRSRVDEDGLRELAASISATGVVQPIVVRPNGNGRYHIVAGERRWMASQKAGKTKIPVVVRHVSPEQAMEMTIVENLQREDLNPMEQARAYERLAREFKMTQEEMARRTGKERASVANFLRLLRLPEPIQEKVAQGELSFGHAKVLLMLDSHEAISKAAQKVMQLSMSVRQTERYVQGILHPPADGRSDKPKRPVDPNVREAERSLQAKLGVKVEIEDKGGKGRITLQYGSLEDFDRILEMLG